MLKSVSIASSESNMCMTTVWQLTLQRPPGSRPGGSPAMPMTRVPPNTPLPVDSSSVASGSSASVGSASSSSSVAVASSAASVAVGAIGTTGRAVGWIVGVGWAAGSRVGSSSSSSSSSSPPQAARIVAIIDAESPAAVARRRNSRREIARYSKRADRSWAILKRSRSCASGMSGSSLNSATTRLPVPDAPVMPCALLGRLCLRAPASRAILEAAVGC